MLNSLIYSNPISGDAASLIPSERPESSGSELKTQLSATPYATLQELFPIILDRNFADSSFLDVRTFGKIFASEYRRKFYDNKILNTNSIDTETGRIIKPNGYVIENARQILKDIFEEYLELHKPSLKAWKKRRPRIVQRDLNCYFGSA